MQGLIIGPASALLPKAHKPQLRTHQQLPEPRLAWNDKGILTLTVNTPNDPVAPFNEHPRMSSFDPVVRESFRHSILYGKQRSGRVMTDGVHFRSSSMARDISWVAWLVLWRSSCLTARRSSSSDAKLSTSPANSSVQNVRATHSDCT